MSTHCLCWQETRRQADAATDCNALSGKTSPVFLISVWRIVDGVQFNVTGFCDEAHQFINGQLQAPVTIESYLTTESPSGTHTVIQGAFAAGSQVTLEVQVGDNAALAANFLTFK